MYSLGLRFDHPKTHYHRLWWCFVCDVVIVLNCGKHCVRTICSRCCALLAWWLMVSLCMDGVSVYLTDYVDRVTSQSQSTDGESCSRVCVCVVHTNHVHIYSNRVTSKCNIICLCFFLLLLRLHACRHANGYVNKSNAINGQVSYILFKKTEPHYVNRKIYQIYSFHIIQHKWLFTVAEAIKSDTDLPWCGQRYDWIELDLVFEKT